MGDFRAEVVLHQNSVDFNGIDHIITSVTLEVRDTLLKAISDIEETEGDLLLLPKIKTYITTWY